MQLSEKQKIVFDEIVAFLNDKDAQVFILKGYAGTGKTTMIRSLLDAIKRMKKYPLLLGPTGRAAKVLRDKTGHAAQTIHRAIYSHTKMEVKRYDENGNLIIAKTNQDKTPDNKGIDKVEYFFGIKDISEVRADRGEPLSAKDAVIIVDESSLISSKPSNGEVFHFGTDILLNDLLTFARLQDGAKIVFVGDPAQLPPVGDNDSHALSEKFFAGRGLNVRSATLTEVLRQSGDGLILKNAMRFRNLLGEQMRNSLTFEYGEGEFEQSTSDDVVRRFFESQPIPVDGQNIIICFSNSQVKEYNERIRQHYFPDKFGIQEGDILQIVKNDYNHWPTAADTDGLPADSIDTNLYNGDFVKVLKVSGDTERLSSFMWKNVDGKRKRLPMSLDFRDVTIMTSNDLVFETKILETLLENDKPNLTPEECTALYLLFRMKHPEIEHDLEAMEAALKNDPYYNALHVKYGYAITAHKSQGGEWETAYVDYTRRTGLSNDHLRWAYTATTRATKRLIAVNAPNITPFSSFSVGQIRLAKQPPKGSFSLAAIDIADNLSFMDTFRRWKYRCTSQRLREIECSIGRVDANQYCDVYHINTPLGEEIIDCWYKQEGYFSHYLPKTAPTDYTPLILEILNDESAYRYEVDYTSTLPSLEALRQKVASACADLDIAITSIQECRDKYFVLYSFKTSGKFSNIQFYFKANGAISRAMPSSDLGEQDALLVSLTEKLSK